MARNGEKSEYRFTVFKPGTPKNVKVRSIVFFIILAIIIFVQSFYWIFANKVEPYVLGMPYSLFFIVLLIIIEFIVLLLLYFLEGINERKGGDV